MDLRQFRHFIAVAEELSFHRAAKRLNIAQPPLTASIKRLEQELGVLLIERTNRVSQLTPAGRIFFDEASKAVAQAESAVSAAKRAGKGLAGRLRLTFQASAIYNILPDLLQKFIERHPDVELDLEERQTDHQFQALLDEQVDIGFVYLPFQIPVEMTVEILWSEKFAVAMPSWHSLASKKEISLSELAEEKWIVVPRRRASAFYDDFHKACRTAGFTPTITTEVLGAQVMVGLVGAGLGLALVPQSMRSIRHPKTVLRRLIGPGTPISYQVAMIYRSSTPLREAFINVAREVVEAEPNRS